MREMTPSDLAHLAKLRERLEGAKRYLLVVRNAAHRQPCVFEEADRNATAIQMEMDAFLDRFPGAIGER